MHWINLHPSLLRPDPGSSRDPSGCGKVPLHNPQQWERPCHRHVSRAEITAQIPLHPIQKNLHPPQIKKKKKLKNERNKRKIHQKIHLFQKKPDLSSKVPLVSKVQEVGGFTGRSPLGIPAFYPDPCWESWECSQTSQTSHSYCSGGSEAVRGAEAEWEEHPWSDSPGSPKLCKACEGAFRGGR